MISEGVWTNTMTEGQEDFDAIYIWGKINVDTVSGIGRSQCFFPSTQGNFLPRTLGFQFLHSSTLMIKISTFWREIYKYILI